MRHDTPGTLISNQAYSERVQQIRNYKAQQSTTLLNPTRTLKQRRRNTRDKDPQHRAFAQHHIILTSIPREQCAHYINHDGP